MYVLTCIVDYNDLVDAVLSTIPTESAFGVGIYSDYDGKLHIYDRRDGLSIYEEDIFVNEFLVDGVLYSLKRPNVINIRNKSIFSIYIHRGNEENKVDTVILKSCIVSEQNCIRHHENFGIQSNYFRKYHDCVFVNKTKKSGDIIDGHKPGFYDFANNRSGWL